LTNRIQRIAVGLALVVTMALQLTAADRRVVEAVRQKNFSLAQTLLKQRADVNASEGDGATALHWAVHWDEPAMVDALIQAGAKANVANDLGVTPLALASANGNPAISEKLLRSGADPNQAGETGITPLMEAAQAGSAAVAKVLLEFGANANAATDDRDQTALMIAAEERYPDVVAVLLAHGADVHMRTRQRKYKVLVDRSSYRSAKTPQEAGTEVEMGGTTALLFAAQSGDLESTKLLLKAGARMDETAADGNTPLVVAVHSGHPSVAAWLLEAGADPNASGAGYTALHAAVLRGDLETIRIILAHGADPNSFLLKGTPVRRWTSMWALPATLIGATPMLVAANYLELDAMRMLTERGATLTATLPNGNTPLLMVAGTQFERLNRPLDHIDTPTDIGDTCCERSESRAFEAVKFLLDSGVDVNQANKAGDTAMHLAAGAGFASIIQLLADHGANVNASNQKGQTPLALVTGGSGQRGGKTQTPAQKKVEELLRKLGATP
jgi:ankyrin repeat protein